MPNHIILASGAVVAVSAVLATAIAIYESPELRRYTDDVRRRVAIALQSLGDGIRPPHDGDIAMQDPIFNRPEDAEGFLQSQRGPGARPGVDADETTRRLQREELMYWNSVRLQKQQAETERLDNSARRAEESAAAAQSSVLTRQGQDPRTQVSSSSTATLTFDDFLEPATRGQDGTGLVVCSGAQTDEDASLRHRGDGARPVVASSSTVAAAAAAAAAAVATAKGTAFANPFSDEYHVDLQELDGAQRCVPYYDDSQSDIYSAMTKDADDGDACQTTRSTTATMEAGPWDTASSPACLFDFESTVETMPPHPVASAEEEEEEQSSVPSTYTRVQEWAQESGSRLYAPRSLVSEEEKEASSDDDDGGMTPTDSVSLIGSGEHLAQTQSGVGGDETLSVTDGMWTPTSWSEVGSQVSEGEFA